MNNSAEGYSSQNEVKKQNMFGIIKELDPKLQQKWAKEENLTNKIIQKAIDNNIETILKINEKRRGQIEPEEPKEDDLSVRRLIKSGQRYHNEFEDSNDNNGGIIDSIEVNERLSLRSLSKMKDEEEINLLFIPNTEQNIIIISDKDNMERFNSLTLIEQNKKKKQIEEILRGVKENEYGKEILDKYGKVFLDSEGNSITIIGYIEGDSTPEDVANNTNVKMDIPNFVSRPQNKKKNRESL